MATNLQLAFNFDRIFNYDAAAAGGQDGDIYVIIGCLVNANYNYPIKSNYILQLYIPH